MRFLRAMPEIQAEESLQLATAIAVGSGFLSASEQRRIIDQWSECAGPRRRPAPITPLIASAIGVGVRNG